MDDNLKTKEALIEELQALRSLLSDYENKEKQNNSIISQTYNKIQEETYLKKISESERKIA